MLPLWVGSGPGAEERRAIAVVVIGGQTLCLLLTLLVTPVAYSLFEDLGRAFRWRPSLGRGPRRWRRRVLAIERGPAHGGMHESASVTTDEPAAADAGRGRPSRA
jgi:hypothetical protein